MKISLNFKFKGSRKYIQGPDIIDAVIPTPLLMNAVVYFVVAIGIGFLSTRMVERKFLNIRNRYFPSRA